MQPRLLAALFILTVISSGLLLHDHMQGAWAADDLESILKQTQAALPPASSLPGPARWTVSRDDEIGRYANGFSVRRYYKGTRQIKCGSSNFNDTFAAYCGVNYQTGYGYGSLQEWQSKLLQTYASSSSINKYSSYSGPPTGVMEEGQLLTGAGMVGQKIGRGTKLAFWRSNNCVADVSMNIVDFCSSDPSTPSAAVREKEAMEMCRKGCIQMAGGLYAGLPAGIAGGDSTSGGGTSGGGNIPDFALPWIAIGPLLVITLLTLLNNLIQGIPVSESFRDLIDFLRGRLGRTPVSGMPPSPPDVQPVQQSETSVNIRPGTVIDGKVWCLPPWEKGGPVWLDKAEYLDWQDKEAQGLVWSDSYGWTIPGAAGEYESTRLRRWDYDTTHKVTDELNDLERSYNNIAVWLKDRQFREAYWNEQLKPRWEELQKLHDQMYYDTVELQKYTFSGSLRELFTCRDPHGKLSVEALTTQIGIITVTGGLGSIPLRLGGWVTLEIPYTAAAFAFAGGTYNSYDRWMSGEPLTQAVVKGYGTAAGVELIGAGLGKGLVRVLGAGAREVVEGGVRSTVAREAGEAMETAAGSALSSELKQVKTAVVEAMGESRIIRSAEGIKKTYGPKLKGASEVEKRIVQTADKIAAGNREKMLELLKQRDRLTELQKSGAITQEQINRIAEAGSREVDDILDRAIPQTMKEFEEKTGIKVLKNFTGNQGSSARSGGANRFIATTDEDRSLAQLFDEKQLQSYADNVHGGDRLAAYDDLNKQFTDMLNHNFSEEAARRNLSSEMLGYTGYAGSGTKAGPGSYDSGFVDVSQQVKGSTIIHSAGSGGTVTSYKTSGQAWTDAHRLARTPSGTVLQGTASRAPGSGVISGESAISMAKNALKIANKEVVEPVELAKGIVRFDKAMTILEGPRFNRALYETAKWLREKPSEAMQSLGAEKLAEFSDAARQAIRSAFKMISGYGE